MNVTGLLRPVPPRDTFRFMTKELRTPDGKPFNCHDYPWVKGICEAFDDPEVRVIALQMAARLGKSMTAQGLMVSGMTHDPDVGMIAMSTKKLLEETIEDKYYKILENTNATRKMIPPRHDRNKHEVKLGNVKIYGAWSGSTTTLADKPPKYKHAGEVDKFDKAKSREADPLDLFFQRGIEIPDRKSIAESTPDLKHTSRIEPLLESGSNCRFLVPCPLCQTYIQLIPGDGSAGGVKFDMLDGKPNLRHAHKTARYVCQSCAGEWGDQWRRPAILNGIWVPEGCKVTKKGKITGAMSGDPEIASFQLGRIYAPTFKFGDIAREICKCIIDPDKWQNTNNSVFGITHSFRSSILSWEDTAERLAKIEYKMGEVPAAGNFLTVGIDVQEDHFVYVVIAWGKHGVGWIVDFGTAWTVEDIRAVLRTKYKHLDGRGGISSSLALIDSGEGRRQDEIIDICLSLNKAKGPWVWPCKGSKSGLQSGKAYKKQRFEDMADRNNKHDRLHDIAGFFHVSVNTPWTQTWINKALFYLEPGTPKSIAIPTDSTMDEDFIGQLINEQREGMDTATGHGTSKWVVVDTTIPWDFRDAVRYAKTAGEIYVRSAWSRLPLHRRIPKQVEPNKTRKATPKAPASPRQKQGKSFVRSGSRKSVKKRFVRGG